MHNLFKFIALALVFSLTACATPVSLDHHRSQSRLDEGLARLIKARADAVALARSRSPTLAGATSSSVSFSSIQSARLALARDAAKDYSLAVNPMSARQPSDKISLLFRAASKAWHAGRAADTDLVLKIAAAGGSACDGANFNLAPRDCQIIAIAPQLTAMQSATDVIFDTEIEWIAANNDGDSRLSAQEMNQLVKAIDDLDSRSGALDTAKTQRTETNPGMRPDIRRFVGQFQVQSWCHAVVAATLIPNAVDADGSGIGLEARRLLTGTGGSGSPALEAALAQGGLSASAISGLYQSYSRDMLKLARVSNIGAQDVSGHRSLCKAPTN